MEGRKQGETCTVILRTAWLRLGGVEAGVPEAEPGDGEASYDALTVRKGARCPPRGAGGFLATPTRFCCKSFVYQESVVLFTNICMAVLFITAVM